MRKSFIYVAILLFLSVKTFSATVDTIAIPRKVMNKTYKAVIVLPPSYASNTQAHPVLYLLHGGYGHFDDWTKKTPNKTSVQGLADQLTDGTYRIMPKVIPNSNKKLALVSSGDSTPMLAEFDMNSDNSKWNFKAH